MNELRLHQARLLASSVRTQCKRALKSEGPKRRRSVDLVIRCARSLDTTVREVCK